MKRPTLDQKEGRGVAIPPEFKANFITTDELAEIILTEIGRLLHQMDFSAAKKARNGPRYFHLGSRTIFYREEALTYFRVKYAARLKAA